MKTIFTFCFFLFCQVSFSQVLHGTATDSLPEQHTLEFDINPADFSDKSSPYFHEKLKNQFAKCDTTFTPEECIALTKFIRTKTDFDPSVLDELCLKAHQLNADERYNEAIENCKKVLEITPNSISAHKEIALAYHKLEHTDLSHLHLTMSRKITEAIFLYGNGSYEQPWILNNLYEGYAIYEGVYRTLPSKGALMLAKSGKLLGAYYGYSEFYNEIIISYVDLTFWLPKLTEADYVKEEDM